MNDKMTSRTPKDLRYILLWHTVESVLEVIL